MVMHMEEIHADATMLSQFSLDVQTTMIDIPTVRNRRDYVFIIYSDIVSTNSGKLLANKTCHIIQFISFFPSVCVCWLEGGGLFR